MSPPTGEVLREILALTSGALAHARAGDWDAASAQVQAIQDRHGGQGINVLLLALTDTLLAAHGGHRGCAPLVQLIWWDTTTGRVEFADEVAPRIRWAGRFLAARAADDEPTARALIDACTDDEFSAGVSGLVEITAHTLNTLDPTR